MHSSSEVYLSLSPCTASSRTVEPGASRCGGDERTDTARRSRTRVGLLRERWAQVKDGHGQVVLLTGDAGIGKSRLVHMLKEHVANEPHVRWECRSTNFQNTALFPLIELFQRLLRFEAHETPDEKVGKLEHA